MHASAQAYCKMLVVRKSADVASVAAAHAAGCGSSGIPTFHISATEKKLKISSAHLSSPLSENSLVIAQKNTNATAAALRTEALAMRNKTPSREACQIFEMRTRETEADKKSNRQHWFLLFETCERTGVHRHGAGKNQALQKRWAEDITAPEWTGRQKMLPNARGMYT